MRRLSDHPGLLEVPDDLDEELDRMRFFLPPCGLEIPIHPALPPTE
jgi:hypothetical protein